MQPGSCCAWQRIRGITLFLITTKGQICWSWSMVTSTESANAAHHAYILLGCELIDYREKGKGGSGAASISVL